VLVVEATKKSGTLITSKFALEYNREVYAIPGSPLDAKSQGTNALLKQGANLALVPQDIVQDLAKITRKNNTYISDQNDNFTSNYVKNIPSELELGTFRIKLFNSLSYSPIEIDDIAEQLEIPINVVSFLLLELELAGKISRLSNNKVYLIA
jgi:DNA processing protein